MATSIITRDIDVFRTSIDDHLKTVSGVILRFRFSFHLEQQKAFVCDDNTKKCHRLNAVVVQVF